MEMIASVLLTVGQLLMGILQIVVNTFGTKRKQILTLPFFSVYFLCKKIHGRNRYKSKTKNISACTSLLTVQKASCFSGRGWSQQSKKHLAVYITVLVIRQDAFWAFYVHSQKKHLAFGQRGYMNPKEERVRASRRAKSALPTENERTTREERRTGDDSGSSQQRADDQYPSILVGVSRHCASNPSAVRKRGRK